MITTWYANPIQVADGEVRLWTLRLDSAPRPEDLRPLSADEAVRAAKYRFEKDRRRFVLVRLALREVLAQFLGILPAHVRFQYDSYGKPSLADQRSGIEFNVSHRKDVALIAVARGRRIGVDVERIEPLSDGESLARRFFSPLEVRTLLGLRADVRDEAFYACWTRKEAFVKALGCGLSLPLDSFSVSLAPGDPPAILEWNRGNSPHTAWSLVSLTPALGYIAAIAAERRAP